MLLQLWPQTMGQLAVPQIWQTVHYFLSDTPLDIPGPLGYQKYLVLPFLFGNLFFSVFEKDIHMAIMLGFFILEIQKFTSATIMQQRLLIACFHIYMHVYAFF